MMGLSTSLTSLIVSCEAGRRFTPPPRSSAAASLRRRVPPPPRHSAAAAQDAQARWRNLLARWQSQHPEFANFCRQAYPLLEKAYVGMLDGMADELTQQGDEALENDFSVQEFLDRYGMRVGQLSHLLSVVGPLAEAASQNDAK
jgi:hypothetical protein